MKKIIVLTATRAEYGLLSPIIKKLMGEDDIQVEVVVTGMHLSPEFGYTYKEIEADGVKITKKIEILMSSDTACGISKSMGLAMISFAEYFEESKPDALLVLGDRYETLAVCCVAMNAQIPIIHMYGGETTEGAIDEAVRHSISKMSYLHFTSTEEYRKRVIQLGEDPNRIFCVGAMGVENVKKIELFSKDELEKSLAIKLRNKYALVTFHPVTLEQNSVEEEICQLINAIEQFPDLDFIITKANADKGGKTINRLLDEFSKKRDNVHLFDSLGRKRYLSAVKYCEMVIGNSSSGLVEVPSFKKPTINIGNRQKGRIRGETVIDAIPQTESITNAICLARTDEYKKICENSVNPYEKIDTSSQIVAKIRSEILFANLSLMKKFYDIKFTL